MSKVVKDSKVKEVKKDQKVKKTSKESPSKQTHQKRQFDPLTIPCNQPWFDLILKGEKTIEGRTGDPSRHNFMLNQVITIVEPLSQEKVKRKVTDIKHYDNLKSYLDAHWKEACPNAKTIAEATKLYLDVHNIAGMQVFSDENLARRGGINALKLEKA